MNLTTFTCPCVAEGKSGYLQEFFDSTEGTSCDVREGAAGEGVLRSRGGSVGSVEKQGRECGEC